MVTQSVLYGLLAAASVGTSVFTMALATRRVELLQLLFLSNLVSVGVATLYLLIASDLSLPSRGQWLLLVIFSSIGLSGYFSYLKALEEGPVAIAVPIVSGEGAVVILLAVLLAGEHLTIGQSLGASAAVGGVVLASMDLSNCLESQEGWPATAGVRSHQGERCLSMELRIINSLRMQAVRASFLGLPAASSRW